MGRKYNACSASDMIQKFIKTLNSKFKGKTYSIKFAVTQVLEQRVIIREWPSGEEKFNAPIYRMVNDPFNKIEIDEKVFETFLNL